MDGMKRCPRCGEYKERSEFGMNRHQHDGQQSYCRICTAARKRESKRHKEYNREYMIQYRIRQAPQIRIRREEERAQRKAIRDAITKEEKRILAEKRLKERETKRNVREENQKIRFAEFLKNFQPTKAYNEKKREWNRNRMKVRRALQRTNGGSITKKQWKIICEHFGNVCVCCGKPEMNYKELSIDHIVPVTKGGTSDWTNLQPLCFSCNSKKHADIIDYRPSNLVSGLREKINIKKRAVKNG